MPRRPRSPSPPRPPQVPRLRLSPIRSRDSVDLDEHRTPKTGQRLPPFVRWDAFLEQWDWKVGEHITTIGPTGSGKTVLNRHLLRRRIWVVVFGVKNRDSELYPAYQREGYELQRTFDPSPVRDGEGHRILFAPRTDRHGAEGDKIRSAAFRKAMNELMDLRPARDGTNYTEYADDINVMVDDFKLGPEFTEVWRAGRSEGISLVASAQEPVNIPIAAYGSATHIFLFKNPDLYRAKRMAELTGINREVTQETILRLPDHEFLYINKSSGEMLRSRVIR